MCAREVKMLNMFDALRTSINNFSLPFIKSSFLFISFPQQLRDVLWPYFFVVFPAMRKINGKSLARCACEFQFQRRLHGWSFRLCIDAPNLSTRGSYMTTWSVFVQKKVYDGFRPRNLPKGIFTKKIQSHDESQHLLVRRVVKHVLRLELDRGKRKKNVTSSTLH